MSNFVYPKWSKNEKQKEIVDEKLIEMIALDMQPMSIVEDVGFRNYTAALQPANPTRDKCRTDP